MSVITTLRAPARFATSAPMIPIGPAPVTSTSSPTQSKLSAVCTAFPNGSNIAATSSGISSGIATTLLSGIQTYSAKLPGRCTPTPSVLRQRCPRPARQLRQKPQTICPSPDTRSPRLNRVTAAPVSAIRPTNSWPTTMGTGTVAAAQASQFQMCTSVPQMALFVTLISTSFGPGSGTGTSCIQRPGSGRAFTSASISFFMRSLPTRARPRRSPRSPPRRPRANGRRTSGCGCAPARAAPPERRSR